MDVDMSDTTRLVKSPQVACISRRGGEVFSTPSYPALPRLPKFKTWTFCFHSSDLRYRHSASVQRVEVWSCKMDTYKERSRTSLSATRLLLAFVPYRKLYIFP